jgi:hypothetical protein
VKFAFKKSKSSLFDRLICFWQVGPYCHCEAILSGPDNKGEYEVASSLPGTGVRIAHQQLPSSDWDIIDAFGDVNSVRSWYQNHLGAKYDYLGILGFIFRPVKKDKNEYFCSESIGNALGIPQSWRLDPNGLYAVLNYKPKQ